MPKPSSQTAVWQRRQQVAALHLKGWTQTAIAEYLNIGQPTVCKDLRAVEAEWLAGSVHDTELARRKELLRLELVEREAWGAWERSKEPAQSAVVSGETGKQQTRRSVKHQHGDPRFLAQINQCVLTRCTLLGLNAPTKIAPTNPAGDAPYQSASSPIVEKLSPEEFAMFKQTLEIHQRITQQSDNHATT